METDPTIDEIVNEVRSIVRTRFGVGRTIERWPLTDALLDRRSASTEHGMVIDWILYHMNHISGPTLLSRDTLMSLLSSLSEEAP